MLHLLRELEKSTNTGCWQYDLATQKLHWSWQTYKIFKISKKQNLTLEGTYNLLTEPDRVVLKNKFLNCIKYKKEYREIVHMINSDGGLQVIEAFGKSLVDTNGLVYAVFGTYKDLTQEQVLAQKAEHNFFELNNYIKSIDTSFIVSNTDDTGRITHVNENFCKLAGYKKEELIGKNHRLISSGVHNKIFFQEMWNTIKNGKVWEGLICNRKKNGDFFWLQTLIFPRFDLNKQIIEYSSVKFDVTEKIKSATKLKEENRKLFFDSQLIAIGEISAGIAHELANPLTIIKANHQRLASSLNSSDRLLRLHESTARSIDRIHKVVSGLQRVSYKASVSKFELVCLNDILNETFEMCRELIDNKDIQLSCNDEVCNIYLNCNEVKVSQLLFHLISNAKDSVLRSKKNDKWIKIEIDETDTIITIKIIDSGEGIPKSIEKSFMDPFVTSKVNVKGTGLGLSLVSSFVKEHGGKVFMDLNSVDTSFVVELPKNNISKVSA